ncbi:MAG: DUF2164 domain-containing protein [Caulobacteraceae bacterium]|nr:DUF2164 domain-containing protein [Caulobacteraceae bacterium]
MKTPIALTPEERRAAAARLRALLAEQLDVEIGGLEAEALLDGLSREVGAVFYNRALADARAVVAAKAEDTDDALHALDRDSGLR